MKETNIIGIGASIIGMLILPTYIAYKLGNIVIGIIIGFILCMSYIIRIVVKK